MHTVTAVYECPRGADPTHYYPTDLVRLPDEMTAEQARDWYARETGLDVDIVHVRGGVCVVREVQS
jgi:hypothetical protein